MVNGRRLTLHPFFKKGKKKDLGNCQSLSPTSVLGKLVGLPSLGIHFQTQEGQEGTINTNSAKPDSAWPIQLPSAMKWWLHRWQTAALTLVIRALTLSPTALLLGSRVSFHISFHTWMNVSVNIIILMFHISPLVRYLSDKTRNKQNISPGYWLRADDLILLLTVPTILYLSSTLWDHPIFCSIPIEQSLLDRCWQIQHYKFKFLPSLPIKKDSFKTKMN